MTSSVLLLAMLTVQYEASAAPRAKSALQEIVASEELMKETWGWAALAGLPSLVLKVMAAEERAAAQTSCPWEARLQPLTSNIFRVMKYFQSDASPALLCHKESAQGIKAFLGSFLAFRRFFMA